MKTRRRRQGQFRVGDVVEVVNPVFVKRVGYPKTVDDYLVEMGQKAGPKIEELIAAVDGGGWIRKSAAGQKVYDRVCRDLAWLLAHRDGFGGRERTLHTFEAPAYRGGRARIYELRTAMTGTYRPGRGGSWYDDPEPPYLAGATPHRLARVSWESFPETGTVYPDAYAGPLDNPGPARDIFWAPEIETCHLRLLQSSP